METVLHTTLVAARHLLQAVQLDRMQWVHRKVTAVCLRPKCAVVLHLTASLHIITFHFNLDYKWVKPPRPVGFDSLVTLN